MLTISSTKSHDLVFRNRYIPTYINFAYTGHEKTKIQGPTHRADASCSDACVLLTICIDVCTQAFNIAQNDQDITINNKLNVLMVD